MAFDAHSNFGVSSVAVAPSPSTTGTSLTVATGEGTRFPAAPFNATLAPSGVLATPANAEIVRVTARSGDVLTITRAQEGSVARAVVVGDLCVASITAKALQDIETTPYARTDAANTFVVGQTLSEATPNVVFRETVAPVDAKIWQLMGAGQTWVIRSLNDAGSSSSSSFTFTRPGDVKVWRDLYEKQRTTPVGHWITVPYNAANFTANVGTWTVDAGDIYVQAYTLIGKTLIYSLGLASTSVTGSPSTLKVALPSGLVSGTYIYTTCLIWDNGVKTLGTLHVPTGGTIVNIQLDLFNVPPFANATNNMHVFGQISFQLQ
jgi:hypothetical protein